MSTFPSSQHQIMLLLDKGTCASGLLRAVLNSAIGELPHNLLIDGQSSAMYHLRKRPTPLKLSHYQYLLYTANHTGRSKAQQNQKDGEGLSPLFLHCPPFLLSSPIHPHPLSWNKELNAPTPHASNVSHTIAATE